MTWANMILDLVLGGIIGWAMHDICRSGLDYKRGYSNGYTIGKMDAHIETMKATIEEKDEISS